MCVRAHTGACAFLYTVLDDMRDTARNFAAHLLGSPKEAAK